MKIIYQQVIAFFAVITLTILLLGFSFSRLAKSFVYDTTWTRLENYSDSVVEQSLQTKNNKVTFNPTSLSTTEGILNGQDSDFTMYAPSKKAFYPQGNKNSTIAANDWKRLKKGQMIRKVNRGNEIDKHQSKKRSEMVEILKPYYYQKKLVAVVAVGTYTSELEANLSRINSNLILALILSLIVSLIISFAFAHRLNRRISVLRDAVNQVIQGHYKIRLQSGNRDEIDDLTNDFNHMTDTLENADSEIKRQEERRQEFLADAAHEMRTPLTTINGILEGFKYGVIPEDSRDKSLNLMMSETQRLIRLVNENLDYAKIRSKSIKLNRTHFNATDVLYQLQEQLSGKAQASNDEIIIKAPDKLPIYADYDRFVQVLVNIITNGIQFTDNGTITVTAKRENNLDVFDITDTGIGMSEEQMKNIFERYYKADASRRSGKYGESGLGLAIVHQLIEQHGGTIKVVSKLGKGTTFSLTFPNEDNYPK